MMIAFYILVFAIGYYAGYKGVKWYWNWVRTPYKVR